MTIYIPHNLKNDQLDDIASTLELILTEIQGSILSKTLNDQAVDYYQLAIDKELNKLTKITESSTTVEVNILLKVIIQLLALLITNLIK